MESTIKEILLTLQMSPSEMANKLSVQRSTFSHLMSGRNKPSYDFIRNLLKTFPELNPDFVILGQKPILRLQEKIDNESSPILDDIKVPVEQKSLSQIKTEHTRGEDNKVPNPDDDTFSLTHKNSINYPLVTDVNSDSIDLESIVHYYSDGTFKEYKPK